MFTVAPPSRFIDVAPGAGASNRPVNLLRRPFQLYGR
jgi:hypothetical protein